MAHEGVEKLCLLEQLNQNLNEIEEPMQKVMLLEMSFYLRNQLLRDSDWAGMAHSIEIRVPFVDSILFEELGPNLLRANGITKRDLASITIDKVPKTIIERKKTGFSTPVAKWTKKYDQKPERGLRAWAQIIYDSVK